MIPVNGWVLAARQALALIDQVDENQVGDLPLPDLVSLGSRLDRLRAKADVLLELVKARIRKHAGNGNSRYPSPNGAGYCEVQPQPPTVEIKKDADMTRVRAQLGSRFNDYFEIRFSLKKDFQERLKRADENEQSLLLEVVQVNPRGARIIFKDD